MCHASQKTRSAVLLPDREKSPAEVFFDIKLGMEVVPAGEIGAGLVVEEDEDTGDQNKEKDWPETRKIAT